MIELKHWIFNTPEIGSLLAFVLVVVFIYLEEVGRHLKYTGRKGLRRIVFPPKKCSWFSQYFNRVTAKEHRQLVQYYSTTRHPTARMMNSSSNDSTADESKRSKGTEESSFSDGGSHPQFPYEKQQLSHGGSGKKLEPPVLVYHESAHSIVFRDHLRRVVENHNSNNAIANEEEPVQEGDSPTAADYNNHENGTVDHIFQDVSDFSSLFFPGDQKLPDVTPDIAGFQPNIVPLPHLQLGPNDEFLPLWESNSPSKWNIAETEVVDLLQEQRAVVKTIKNNDWTSFLHRFTTPHEKSHSIPDHHQDIPPHGNDFQFNSFVTSTTLLPSAGRKMRCYGKSHQYTTGVVFALPQFENADQEQEEAEAARTWSWPAGYSAKTEFNIDSRGNLMNGRQEAIVPLAKLREYNDDYLSKNDYMIAGRILKGGLTTVPYNEVFVRVGGRGRISNHKDCATGEARVDSDGTGRSLKAGVGLPVALFVRTACFGHLISLLRTRARLMHIWGERHVSGIPLLLISTELGVRVLTDKLQKDLLKIAAKSLNPFQNPQIAHKTTIDDTEEKHLETKLEELIDLDESIRGVLTPEECAKLAGGFGATDESIAQILKDAMIQDKENEQKEGCPAGSCHMLQDIVNEGLAAAVRSGDYYTSRQLLILYSLVASEKHHLDMEEAGPAGGGGHKLLIQGHGEEEKKMEKAMTLKRQTSSDGTMTDTNGHLPPPPPPPPLDTDRLRSATNSDGLLAVLGAAQVLKAMRDGGAKKRTQESFLAVEE